MKACMALPWQNKKWRKEGEDTHISQRCLNHDGHAYSPQILRYKPLLFPLSWCSSVLGALHFSAIWQWGWDLLSRSTGPAKFSPRVTPEFYILHVAHLNRSKYSNFTFVYEMKLAQIFMLSPFRNLVNCLILLKNSSCGPWKTSTSTTYSEM